MERIEREVESPILQHLKWKCRFFTNTADQSRSQCNCFLLECNKSWRVSNILKGVSRLENGVIVEYVSRERIVWVDVNKKELLEVEGVNLSGLQHNQIVDLSVEGDRWEGDVLDGKPYGWGVLFDKEGTMVYEGFRIDEKNVCYGRRYYADIPRVEYEGEWCDGVRWGRGVLFDRNGVVVYDGEWLNDDRLEKRVNITSASMLLHNHVEELRVSDGCCNGRDLTELDLRGFVNLKKWSVGSNCFDSVDKVKLIGLRELESVVIGMRCFTVACVYGFDSYYHFYVKNCPKLKSLMVGRYSFSDYTVCEIENVDALEVIEMGDVNEASYNFRSASLELKSILIHNE